VINLGIEVISVDKTGELNFLNFNNLLLFTGFLFLFVTVKTEFAVVHNFTYGRVSLSAHHNEIKSLVVCSFQSLCKSDDTVLCAVVADYTDVCVLRKLDFFVDFMLFSVSVLDSKAPPINKKCGEEYISPRNLKSTPYTRIP
jgi:hypothetical protein